MSGILSTQVSHIVREQMAAGSIAAHPAQQAPAREPSFFVAWEARPKPRPASPANVSKRGLSARLYATNQTLIMVKARLPTWISAMVTVTGWGLLPACSGQPIRGSGRRRFGAIGQARGYADRRTAARHVARHDRSRADLGKVPDADVADDRSPRAEQDTPANPGRAVRGFDVPPDGDVLQYGHLVADGDERSDHDAGGMIQEHRRPDRRRWMDAHLKGIRRLALQQQGEVAAIPLPKPVRHAPGL